MGPGSAGFGGASSFGRVGFASGATTTTGAGSRMGLGASGSFSGCGSGIFLPPVVRSNHVMRLVPPFRANLLYHSLILLSKHQTEITSGKPSNSHPCSDNFR